MIKTGFSGKETFISNFDQLEQFLNNLRSQESEFNKMINRKLLSAELKKLNLAA